MKHVENASEPFRRDITFIFRVESFYQCFYPACRNFTKRQRLSRKQRNKMQRSVNGNQRGSQRSVAEPVCFQNIPGKCGPDRVGDIITDLIDQYRPLVLFIAEARSDVVAEKTPHGYVHHPGTLKYKSFFKYLGVIIWNNIFQNTLFYWSF